MNSPKQKKIAVLGLSYPFRGGISHYSTLFVRELRKKYTVKFITLNRQDPATLCPGKTQYDHSKNKLVEDNHSLVDSLNPFTWLKTILVLKQERVDLLVVQWWNPFFGFVFGTIANLLAIVSDSKICFLCHNVIPHESTLFDRILSKYAFLKAGYFITHSEEDRRNLLLLKPNAVVVTNSHPTYSIFKEFLSYEKPDARRKLRIPLNKNVILYFGLIRPYKGLKYLIVAMQQVVRHINSILLIVGEFYESKEKYLSLIRELDLEEHTLIVDKYINNEDVPLYFCSSDVVVLPYINATQSGIVQIAFALNKPVITTNVGGLPEAVQDGETGFVVETESPESLAGAIVKYYEGNFENKFSEAIKKGPKNFSWDTEVRNIELFLAEKDN